VFRLCVAAILVGGVCLRCLVALSPHSGMATPPMYGDFEAQRHWLEVTTALPLRDWYRNTTDNDLQYWGLDYPPLTAYGSLLWGRLAQFVGLGDVVALHSSRGCETPRARLFMRMSVVLSDVAVFFPAALAFSLRFHLQRDRQLRALALLVLQPGLLLIDHGHFQYNGVSLGLALAAVALVHAGRDVLGSVAFVLSMLYKQMSLYYAPAFFFFLLGKAVTTSPTWSLAIRRVAKLGVAAVATVVLCCLPFLTSADTALALLHRVFPVARGLFEDKVANLWCAILPVVKLKRLFSQQALLVLSTVATSAGIVPVSLLLSRRVSHPVFVQGLAVSAFAFFLCSFQVHEKTILLPLLPVTLLALDYPSLSCWLNLVGCFSMFPLLLRDGLLVPYFVLTAAYFFAAVVLAQPRRKWPLSLWFVFANALHLVHLGVSPPARYPDLFAQIYVTIAFACFAWSYLLLVFRLFRAVSSAPKQHLT